MAQSHITHFDADELDGDGYAARRGVRDAQQLENVPARVPHILARVMLNATVMLVFALAFGLGAVQLLQAVG